jgi:hypothetical protein
MDDIIKNIQRLNYTLQTSHNWPEGYLKNTRVQLNKLLHSVTDEEIADNKEIIRTARVLLYGVKQWKIK